MNNFQFIPSQDVPGRGQHRSNSACAGEARLQPGAAEAESSLPFPKTHGSKENQCPRLGYKDVHARGTTRADAQDTQGSPRPVTLASC